MARLSVVMIVKNEAQTITSSLKELSWADEVVVLDSGSTDGTAELASQQTDKVYSNDDWQGYGIQRQRAQSYADCEWVLMIDADERLTPELVEEIKNVVTENDQGMVYALPRLSYCFGRYIRHGGWYPDYVVRLYPRKAARYNHARVHEKLDYPGSLRCRKLKHDMLHYTYRDLQHYLVKSAQYASEWAVQNHHRRASISRGLIHGIGCFLRMYVLKAGFLDARPGLLLAILSAHSTFIKYADLWIRQTEAGSKP